MSSYTIGLDFACDAVHVVVVDVRSGRVAARSSEVYAFGADGPPDEGPLPAGYAVGHPLDWLAAAVRGTRGALIGTEARHAEIIGIGVAFPGSVPVPCRADGRPLCTLHEFRRNLHAWPKLPQHCPPSLLAAAEHFNIAARQHNEPWLARGSGSVSHNALFPKLLETLQRAPDVAAAAEVWVEAGDWIVWQLIDGPTPRCRVANIARSLSFAGFKAHFHAGYPSATFCDALHPRLDEHVRHRLAGAHMPPGNPAGGLSADAARLLGLPAGIPVAVATGDIHAHVPGCGVASPSTMVMLLGESARFVMNSRIDATTAGVIGAVESGILPGYFGYEIPEVRVSESLEHFAAERGLSAEEATALQLRCLCDGLRRAGVPVRRFVAAGEPAATNPRLMQTFADVLDARIKPAASDQPAALGAAILGCLAAGRAASGHASMSQTIHAMAAQRKDLMYRPDLQARKAYDRVYEAYCSRDAGRA